MRNSRIAEWSSWVKKLTIPLASNKSCSTLLYKKYAIKRNLKMTDRNVAAFDSMISKQRFVIRSRLLSYGFFFATEYSFNYMVQIDFNLAEK
ncbi:hypothetical protein IT409_02665 [Candidatus Falkowbacteria bacterium]|nr:hypothetical protein [Candidatus Falkowbacteria bacterium]